MKINRDIMVCDDCLFAIAYGDYPDIDDEDESKKRNEEIDAGLASFEGQLVSDDYDSSDPDSLQYECRGCGYIHNHSMFNVVDDCEEQFHQCPECESTDTEVRSDGRDEFSWSPCDCCGSDLGGSRTRMAELIVEDTNVPE